ncbi:hypothetical protein [Roseomonas indoligenes]|uniref:Alpha/beta hydrolase n=1 Tax=Roseomonas indoligenes TaxID=2820811 RepID=A0A940S6F4_9PROT|nr:hypothetical protein [Pararoseomonas indoligenes]MBP0493900.1 hypothetical protein [Pararoseomonas indoligenes]
MIPAEDRAEGGGPPARVRRRHVFYVPGYDPRSPRTYFLLFSRELRKFAALHGIAARMRAGKEDPSTHWHIAADWPDSPVETVVDCLSWHEIAVRDFAVPKWRVALLSLRVLGVAIRTGTVVQMLRLNWKFGIFSLYPWAMATLYALAALGLVAAFLALAAALGLHPLAGLVPAALGLFGLLRLTEYLDRRFYVWYLINDWIFTWRHRTHRDPQADTRFEDFARRVADAARDPTLDEVLVIGHSSGSFVAISVTARALELLGEAGREGPRLSLMTIGGNTPIAAAGRPETRTRRAIRNLVTDDRLFWVDYFAPQDVLNFPWLDPVSAFRLDLGGRPRHNPTVRSARFREIFSAERYAELAYRFYELHFQFLRANDRHGEYEFYRFLAGPEPLESVTREPG